MNQCAIEFNQELVDYLKPSIEFVIKKTIKSKYNSDFCLDYDDLYQESLMHVWNATKIFDASKGMKFRTFAIMHLYSRLGCLRNKMNKHGVKTKNFSQIKGGWSICGTALNEDNVVANHSSIYDKTLEQSVNGSGTDAINEILDAKSVLKKIDIMLVNHEKKINKNIDIKYNVNKIKQLKERKLIFSEYYILGKTESEIIKDNNMSLSKVKKNIRTLNRIYKTLISGEQYE
jgi:DNA-directed RNA polymerase specialized sigma subunit